METVRMLKIKNPSEDFKDQLNKLMREFSCTKRYAKDVILLAKNVISSQKSLIPTNLSGVQGKIAKTKRKIKDYNLGKEII
ncbi:MAG: hypothetical protein FH753_08020 [Firmicutes bacterium]|nr:hypothetical protein [Bacillota bacterium]